MYTRSCIFPTLRLLPRATTLFSPASGSFRGIGVLSPAKLPEVLDGRGGALLSVTTETLIGDVYRVLRLVSVHYRILRQVGFEGLL
jgi:hypothetical protein